MYRTIVCSEILKETTDSLVWLPEIPQASFALIILIIVHVYILRYITVTKCRAIPQFISTFCKTARYTKLFRRPSKVGILNSRRFSKNWFIGETLPQQNLTRRNPRLTLWKSTSLILLMQLATTLARHCNLCLTDRHHFTTDIFIEYLKTESK